MNLIHGTYCGHVCTQTNPFLKRLHSSRTGKQISLYFCKLYHHNRNSAQYDRKYYLIRLMHKTCFPIDKPTMKNLLLALPCNLCVVSLALC